MRQGRGDDDYSSLFRQYFPAGGSLKGCQVSNGDDNQPRFAGLEEEKGARPEQGAPTIEVESKTVAMGEVNVEKAGGIVIPAPEATMPTAAHSSTHLVESAAQTEASGKEEASGEDRGMWGGFWRRRTGE
jgi:hypothetical protein